MIQTEFLEDAYPHFGPQLLPSDPHERAAVRLFVDVVGQLIPLFFRLLNQTDREVREEAKKEITNKTKALGDLIEAQSDGLGPFFLGERLSLAEIVLVPFIYRFAPIFEKFRSFKWLDVDQRVKKSFEAASQRQAFRDTTVDLQKYEAKIVARLNLTQL